ncbi:MAG TPA: tetratricopeptide repeat protein [Candidatus Eisenbacteria bacterium]|nr:tetratricopeptide repeat protein [Candidatus Eisenbacteria bacterium]
MRASKSIRAALLSLALCPATFGADGNALDAAKQAYAKGDYSRAIEILKGAAASESNDADLYVLLSRSYLQLEQYDAAVSAGEKAVTLEPKNSEFHRVLGEAYGGKADHSSMFSAYSLARKTQKEFEVATQLDPRNFEALQNLVEYDCAAPGMVGGGEDKAQPLIQKLMGMDAAEGHYAAGNCRLQKKDYAAADAEFAKALESKPKTAKRIYDIGDFYLKQKNTAQLLAVADAGEKLAPSDPRGKFYRAAAFVLEGRNLEQAGQLLHEYLQTAPMNSDNPRPWTAHYWLGQLEERKKNAAGARAEYEAALKLNGKYKPAQDALKQLRSQ